MYMFNSKAFHVKIKLKFHLREVYSSSVLEASQEWTPNVRQQLKAHALCDLNLYFQMANRASFKCSQAATRLIWRDKQRPQTVHWIYKSSKHFKNQFNIWPGAGTVPLWLEWHAQPTTMGKILIAVFCTCWTYAGHSHPLLPPPRRTIMKHYNGVSARSQTHGRQSTVRALMNI